LGHVGSFLDADTLYPASGALATFLLSGFIPSKCVPLSLMFYTAASAKADYLVTSDTKLQHVGTYQDVAILSPRRFLEILKHDVSEE
jgi:hypothetical protein